MTAAPVRVGLIGAGSMGSLHARVLTESNRAELAWVADPDATAGRAVADRHDVTWMAEPALDTVDAVVVAAPTERHPDIALEVLSSGRALLIEKPIADSIEDARRIVERADALDLPLMAGFLERFNPVINAALDFVEDPVHVSCVRQSPYVARIATGVASDLLIHDLDILLRLFRREPSSLAARFGQSHPLSRPGSEDAVDVVLEFGDGALATAAASRLTQRKVRSLVIHELEREVELDLVRQDITVFRHVGNAPADDATGLGYRQQTVIDIPFVKHQREPLATQLDRFLDVIGGTVDAAAERATLLAPHELLQRVRAAADR